MEPKPAAVGLAAYERLKNSGVFGGSMSDMCDEAKGVVHWFGVSGDSFPDVHYLGAFDMGDTEESFNVAWDKNISPLCEHYPLILREDQAQGLAIDLLDALEELTQQRVRGEVE